MSGPGVHEKSDQEGSPSLSQGVSHHEVDGLGRGPPGWSYHVAEDKMTLLVSVFIVLHGHVHGHRPVKVEEDHTDADDDKTEDYLLLGDQYAGHQDRKAELCSIEPF